MGSIIFQVDAFTAQPFHGNPAGVCPLPEPAAEKWMQNIAAEMNLSETAFLVRQAEGFNLRWFTPAAEVDLCGHATLASAHILWETGVLAEGETARFHTRSGLLTARKSRDWIEMDFPAKPEQAATPPPGLLEALGVEAVYIGRNQFDYLVVVRDEETVRNIQPDMGKLRAVEARGTIVTSRATGSEYDFVSRFFAPAVGVPEDPVTGSAHCCLAPYWSQYLGKSDFTAYQASPRGGVVRCAVQGDRVVLAGQAVTVLRGEIAV